MASIQGVKERVLFWKDWYPVRIVVMRRRGDQWVPEFTEGVRVRYEDRPNIYLLKTGEETKAVDLEGVLQDTGGRPTAFLLEGEDGQLVPWRPKFKDGEVKEHLIENLDERLNFHVTHLEKKEEKYTIPGFIAENRDMIMVVVTALAVGIIFYAAGAQFGDAVPYLQELSNSIPSLADAIQSSGGGASPPGR